MASLAFSSSCSCLLLPFCLIFVLLFHGYSQQNLYNYHQTKIKVKPLYDISHEYFGEINYMCIVEYVVKVEKMLEHFAFKILKT